MISIIILVLLVEPSHPPKVSIWTYRDLQVLCIFSFFMSMKVFYEMPSSDGQNISFFHKKYRQTGKAAWPEVLIVFCMI